MDGILYFFTLIARLLAWQEALGALGPRISVIIMGRLRSGRGIHSSFLQACCFVSGGSQGGVQMVHRHFPEHEVFQGITQNEATMYI